MISLVGGVGTILAQLKALPVPEGWLHCNGGCYDGKEFPQLFPLLRGNRLNGDPVNYFRVPDERTMMPPDSIVMLIVRAL